MRYRHIEMTFFFAVHRMHAQNMHTFGGFQHCKCAERFFNGPCLLFASSNITLRRCLCCPCPLDGSLWPGTSSVVVFVCLHGCLKTLDIHHQTERYSQLGQWCMRRVEPQRRTPASCITVFFISAVMCTSCMQTCIGKMVAAKNRPLPTKSDPMLLPPFFLVHFCAARICAI